jgi:hypothetical protein
VPWASLSSSRGEEVPIGIRYRWPTGITQRKALRTGPRHQHEDEHSHRRTPATSAARVPRAAKMHMLPTTMAARLIRSPYADPLALQASARNYADVQPVAEEWSTSPSACTRGGAPPTSTCDAGRRLKCTGGKGRRSARLHPTTEVIRSSSASRVWPRQPESRPVMWAGSRAVVAIVAAWSVSPDRAHSARIRRLPDD